MVKRIFRIIVLFLVIAFVTISVGLMSINYFLVPAIEKKVRQIVAEHLGKRAEISQVNIKLPEAIVLVKGFKIADYNLAKYNYSVTVDEATLHVGLISTFLQKKLIFDETHIKNAVLVLEKKGLPPPVAAPAAEPPPANVVIPKQPATPNISKDRFSELYVRKLTAENLTFVFKDYSVAQPSSAIEVVNIDGELDNFLVSFRKIGNLKGAIRFKGYFNSAQKGSLEVGGTIAKRGNEIDFDLKSEIYNADLTCFSQYYANTSFTILKEARVDINSDAVCRKNELMTYHDVCIHNIKLNDIAPTSQDTLFSLPATTVIKFFNEYGGEVKFSFNIEGTLNDPKFEPGSIIKEVMSKAMGEKIAARLRELPRDMVKISEKAIKGDIDLGKESQIWFKEIEKKLEDMKKEFKKKRNSDSTIR